MHKVITLKDGSIHIVNNIYDFLNLVEDVMGIDSKRFIIEEIIDKWED